MTTPAPTPAPAPATGGGPAATGTDGDGSTPPAPTPAPPPTPTPAPAGQPAEPPKTGDDDGKPAETVETLPDWAQKLIRDTRAEAAQRRTSAEQQTTQAAEKARQEMAQQIGKALGLIENGDAPDPDALTKQLADRETDLRRERIENAAYRAAEKAGANPAALLDSRAFLNAAHKLDPEADSFAADIDTAITAAVDGNASLKAAAATPARSVTDPSGARDTTGQLTRADLAGMTPAEIQAARKAGRLTALLTGSSG